MPKETIQKLEDHLGRVLVAGAHLAAADSELAKDKTALENLAKQLGAKAPVLGQLAENINKVQSANGPEAVRELLTLTAQVAQVRAAQCALAGAEGAIERLPATVALGTPCNAREIYDLHEALVRTGSGRAEKVQGAIDRGDIADLRLMDAVVHAIGDGYLGQTVTERALPLLGAAVAEPLRRRFNPKGGTIDGRRLRALVAIEKDKAKDLIIAGLKEGRADLREVALDALADHCAGLPELEEFVLERAKDRSMNTRRAATRALAGYASDGSLEALLGALDTDATRDAAAEALARSKHPKAVDKLLDALDASLEPVAEKKPAKAKKAAPKKAAAKPAKEINPEGVARARACAILTALAAFTDSRIAERAAPLLATHGAPAARALVGSGSKAHLEAVVATLDGTDETLFASSVAAAKKLGPKVAFTKLAPALELGAKAKPVEVARAVAVLGGVEKDKAWLKPVTALLEKSTNAEVLAAAGEAIQRIGDKAAVKPLLAAVSRRDLDYRVGHSLVEALGQLGDASIIPTLLDSFDERRDYYGWWSIQRAVLALADRSTVEQVRELFSKQNEKTQKHWRLRHLLQQLVERFPGA